jgi:CRISPR system Cascade subunit CasD
MRHYLLFQLFGPLASWGDIAVGEVRPSFDRPSKSAVLGLVAAALGYSRDLTTQHQSLAEHIRFAVRMGQFGTYLRDYHTVQSPPGKQPSWVCTRRDEVVYQETGTLLSYREYFCDMLATVCLWKAGDGGPSLVEIAHRLKQPTFTLYLGRKSCPLALPLAPQLVEADSIRAALDGFVCQWSEFGLKSNDPANFWEGARGEYDGNENESALEIQRWDQPDSRISTRWQFRPRSEFQHLPTQADR